MRETERRIATAPAGPRNDAKGTQAEPSEAGPTGRGTTAAHLSFDACGETKAARQVVTCEGCEFVRDEPWAGKREICHRCMAPGECQGYAVGFDRIWTSPAPKWCGRRRSVEARSFGAASDLAQDDGVAPPGADFRFGAQHQSSQAPGSLLLPTEADASAGTPGERIATAPAGPRNDTGGGLRPSALKDPPRFESRGELHPGAMDAPMRKTRAAASDRWAALAAQLRKAAGTDRE